MSLSLDGFDSPVSGADVSVTINNMHPLVKLARRLPWTEMLEMILPDLQQTSKLCWWRGRPLKIRIHLGIYILQQMFNLTDRQAEIQLQDNAAFRLFCGYGLLPKWHVPDHTKIEDFRSRLTPETQRMLANLITVEAVKNRYTNPAKLDVDSTIQEANISPPSIIQLMFKTAALAKRLTKPLNKIVQDTVKPYTIKLKNIRALAMQCFWLKRKNSPFLKEMLQKLWRAVFRQVLPILKDSYRLEGYIQKPRHWNIKQAFYRLRTRGFPLLDHLGETLFGIKSKNKMIHSLHATAVTCFNKNKLNKQLQYGRAYQLGRIEGNYLICAQCDDLWMADAASLPEMLSEHEVLFGEDALESVAVDQGYYSNANEKMLEEKNLPEYYLPQPKQGREHKKVKIIPGPKLHLHNRRSGIEALIGHTKHGGQLGRSRMKSDATTLSAGYAAVLGFNLRQFMRHITGAIPPLYEKSDKNQENGLQNVQNTQNLLLGST